MRSLLMFALFFVIATTIMGILVTTVLSMGLATARPVALAALAGLVIAIPTSWLVTRQITSVMVR
ncbi:MAG: hypothetical protein KGM18_00210 [Sphingomonadales bacterium]|nr:hypothetical protein [Sphingomonadales bacterium]